MAQQLKYYQSLSPDFQKGYKQDSDFTLGTAQTLLRMADDLKDEALKKDLQQILGAYMPNRPVLPGVQGLPN